MKEIIDVEHCTGCGTCINVCPKDAISVKIDSEGFEFPYIDQKKCIDCGLCMKKCPSLLEKSKSGDSKHKAYAARIVDETARWRSSSGGIFYALAQQIIEESGVVVGAAYNEKFEVVYRIVDTEKGLPSLQGSKYLQCKIDNKTFKQIREYLQNGRKVLFSGLACQVEGLHSYLGKDYDNLFCCDLICMGIPSAIVWRKYLRLNYDHDKITAINFKEKSAGWSRFHLAVTTLNGEIKERGINNSYFKSMFKTYNMRRSCFVCPFKKMERMADITLGDCWGAVRLVPEMNDEKGLSSVVIHSAKGEMLWLKLVNKVYSKEIPVEEVIKGNPNMIENKTCNWKGRRIFYFLLRYISAKFAFAYAAR